MKGEENLLSVEQCTAVNSPRLCAIAESPCHVRQVQRCIHCRCSRARTRLSERSLNDIDLLRSALHSQNCKRTFLEFSTALLRVLNI